MVSGVSDKSLLDSLVGVCLVFCEALNLGWDVSERGMVGVSEVVLSKISDSSLHGCGDQSTYVVEHSGVTFLYELSVWAKPSQLA